MLSKKYPYLFLIFSLLPQLAWGDYTYKNLRLDWDVEVQGTGLNTVLIYRGGFGQVESKLCANKNFGPYLIEVKYDESPNNSLLFQYFNPTVYYGTTANPNNLLSNGWASSSINNIRGNQHLYLKIELKLKGDIFYDSTEIDLTNRPLVNVKVNCVHPNYQQSRWSAYEFQSTSVAIVSKAGKVSLNRVCTLTQAEQTVPLETVFVSQLESSQEVYGGRFPIGLNCAGAAVSHAYWVVTDANQPSNTSQVLTLSSSSTAKGVGLKIYPEAGGNALTYGTPVTSPIIFGGRSNMSALASNIAGTPSVNSNFKVHYVKQGQLGAGSVSAQMIYNVYYK